MKTTAALFLIILFLISCKKDNTPSAPDQPLSVDSTALHLRNVSNHTDSFNIKFEGAWSVIVDPSNTSWIEVSPTSGTGHAKVYVKALEVNTLSLPARQILL